MLNKRTIQRVAEMVAMTVALRGLGEVEVVVGVGCRSGALAVDGLVVEVLFDEAALERNAHQRVGGVDEEGVIELARMIAREVTEQVLVAERAGRYEIFAAARITRECR